MKKILLIPLMLLTMIPMAACSGSNADLILPEQQPENSGSGDEDDSTDPADPTPGGALLLAHRQYRAYGTADSKNT